MDSTVPKSKLYDLAKCVTTILVVVAHVTTMYTPNAAISVAGRSVFLEKFTSYIYVFHMPLFFFLSGCVYSLCIEQGKYANAAPFMRGKVKRLLIPYLVFGLLYVAPTMCILGVTNAGYGSYVLEGILLSRNSRHLWYLLTLFWIYAVYILLRPLFLKGVGPLLAACGISLALFAASMVTPNYFQLQAACSYQLFFIAGIIVNRYYKQIDRVCSKCYVAGIVLPFALAGALVYNPNIISTYAYRGIGIAMVMVLCWTLLRHFPKLTQARIFQEFKKNAYGIYLFHPMIIYVLFYFLGQCGINPVILSIVISIAATVLSFYATKLVRTLHIQFVVGERFGAEIRKSLSEFI